MAVNLEKIKDLDNNWTEVMKLAEQYGFICQAFGGTATLATHKNQLEAFGEEKYIERQHQMFRNNMKGE